MFRGNPCGMTEWSGLRLAVSLVESCWHFAGNKEGQRTNPGPKLHQVDFDLVPVTLLESQEQQWDPQRQVWQSLLHPRLAPHIQGRCWTYVMHKGLKSFELNDFAEFSPNEMHLKQNRMCDWQVDRWQWHVDSNLLDFRMMSMRGAYTGPRTWIDLHFWHKMAQGMSDCCPSPTPAGLSEKHPDAFFAMRLVTRLHDANNFAAWHLYPTLLAMPKGWRSFGQKHRGLFSSDMKG